MTWSESFRIGSGFLADSYLRSDPPSADELGKVRRHVEGTFEGLEPPPADSAVAVGGTATSLRRLVGAELAHETLERGIRVLSTHADRAGRRALRARPRARAAAAGRDPDPRGDLRPARPAAADRARRPARGAAARARRGPAAWLARSDRRESSAGRSSTMSSPFSMPASPPFFMRTCAPVRACTAIEKSGSWPDQQHVVPEARRERLGVERAARELRLDAAARRRAPRRRASRCPPRAPSGSSGTRRSPLRAASGHAPRRATAPHPSR